MNARICFRTCLTALTICLTASLALGQSGNRSETGAAADDLQLSGPANNAVSPAPPTDIEIPSVDEQITKHAPETDDIDTFIGTKPIPDLDPDRSPKAAPADVPPSLPADAESPAAPADSQQQVTAKAGDVQSPDVAALAKRLATLEAFVGEQATRVDELAQAQEQMIPRDELKAIREEIAALRQSFQSVARANLDAPSGNQTPQRKVGKLVIENLTGLGYTMNVNGYDLNILPGRQEVSIEVGNVVTEIRGFEAPRAWSADNFRDVNGQQQLAIQIR